jgi:type IV pilus assembly protein PilV
MNTNMNKNSRIAQDGPTVPSFAERGVTLIEVLVTMLIVAVALFGATGMQLSAVRYQQTAHNAQKAVGEAMWIAERMRANPAAFSLPVAAPSLDRYIVSTTYADASTLPADPSCGSAAVPCTAGQIAQLDVLQWKQKLSANANLPGGRGALILTTNPGGNVDPTMRQVVVMWSDKGDNQENADDSGGIPALPTDPACPPAQQAPGIKCYVLQVQP